MFGNIDRSGTFLASVYEKHLAIVAYLYILFLPFHGFAELVDGSHFGVHELVVATCASHIVAPDVAGAGAGGPGEEQGHAVLAGSEEYPSHAYLLVGKTCALMGVAICVVALHPGSEVFGCRFVD